MTMFLAIVFFVAGGICLTRAKGIMDWMIAKAAKARGQDIPSLEAFKNPGLLLFIRVIGFLALINGLMLLFVSSVQINPN
jgi:hypothetical protein